MVRRSEAGWCRSRHRRAAPPAGAPTPRPRPEALEKLVARRARLRFRLAAAVVERRADAWNCRRNTDADAL